MRIRVGLLGILGHYAGCQEFELDLAEGASTGDVVEEIARRFGKKFPKEVWERDHRRFAPGILAYVDQTDVEDYDAPLSEGNEVLFVTMVAGG